MKNFFWITLIIILLVLGFSFYWFSIRPSQIIKNCFQTSESVKKLMIKANKNDEEINYITNEIYQDCLKANGIKK